MSTTPFGPPVKPVPATVGFAAFANTTNAWPKKSVTIAR
jgi:hypothetical protein